jgi:hypothetical protein
MTGKRFPRDRGRSLRWAAGALFLAVSWSTGQLMAQTVLTATPAVSPVGHTADPIPATTPGDRGLPDPGIVQTGCAGCGCGSGLGSLCGPGELGSGGCGSCCYPGRNFCCSDCEWAKGPISRFFCGFYQCVCCPDPCYDPCWLAVADTGFFVDAARPVTQLKLIWDNQFRFTNADRAEYLMARYRTNPNQLEAQNLCAQHGIGKGIACVPGSVDIQDLYLYTEAAIANFSLFTAMPYREMDPDTAGINSLFMPNNPTEMPMTTPLPAGASPANPVAGVNTQTLNNNVAVATQFNTTADVVTPAAGFMLTKTATIAAGSSLPQGAVLPNGMVIPATAPGTKTAAPLVLPAGTRILGASRLAAGSTFSAGSALPAGTNIMGNVLPQGSLAVVAMQVAGPVAGCCPASGFGDLIIGTKSMLLDCSLMQITFQFKTWLPTGDFTKGLGTAHVSLEPSILLNVCCSKNTYLQGQFAYWIPVGGDSAYEGNVYHSHFSLNHVLWCPCPGVQLIGSAELGHYRIMNGLMTATDTVLTDPKTGQVSPVSTNGKADFVYLGPGVRLFMCDKLDLGVGSQFALTKEHFAEEWIRAEFRWRF